jgi:Flp pilus assembly pilin Flp
MMMRNRISLTVESGQTMAEYAFVLSVIILVAVGSLTLFSEAITAGFNDVIEMFESIT